MPDFPNKKKNEGICVPCFARKAQGKFGNRLFASFPPFPPGPSWSLRRREKSLLRNIRNTRDVFSFRMLGVLKQKLFTQKILGK